MLTPTLESIIKKWSNTTFILPIEEISQDLLSVYGYDDLIDIEFEYIVEQIAKELNTTEKSTSYLNEILDRNLFPKIDCILAILKNPYELTNDLTAFVNTVLVCNDMPICEEELIMMPTHYIERGLYAINKLLPKDMDLRDIYWNSNIQHYIFICYDQDSLYMLPKMIDYMEEDLFNAMLKSDQVRSTIRKNNFKLRGIIHEIVNEINSEADNVRISIQEDNQNNIVESFMVIIEDNSDISESDRFVIKKYLQSYIYKKFYKYLMPEPEEFS